MLQLTPAAATSDGSGRVTTGSVNRVRTCCGSPAMVAETAQCASFYVTQARDGDLVGVSEGIALCVDRDAADLLDELVLDCRVGGKGLLYIRSAG